VVVINVVMDRSKRVLLAEPEIISRGFVFLRDAEDLMQSARQTIRRMVETSNSNGNKFELVQDALSKLFYNETKRRPMIFVFVNEI
jgi:ribonuclease J